jgi:hypothetical protein
MSQTDMLFIVFGFLLCALIGAVKNLRKRVTNLEGGKK